MGSLSAGSASISLEKTIRSGWTMRITRGQFGVYELDRPVFREAIISLTGLKRVNNMPQTRIKLR